MTDRPRPARESTAHHLETRAVHAAREVDATAALVPPIFQTSTFELRHAADGARFSGEVAPSEFYTRWGNPTVDQARQALADLEETDAAMLFSSGMGAIAATFLASLEAGDHVVVAQAIYSGVSELTRTLLSRFGVERSVVDARDVAQIADALRPRTRLVFVETPINPTLDLCDLEAIGRLGRDRGVRTAVDSTFGTPVNQRPASLGIDVVVHSATKYLGGHSDLTAGVVCGSREFVEKCWGVLKLVGACISPFEAWLLLRGLKTLPLRVERQNRSAGAIAEFLDAHPDVERVRYPGLASHPQHDLARRQMLGFGGMLSFELRGGRDRGVRCAESLEIIRLAVSLGGVESLIQHPASMTHGMLPEEDLKRAGIAPGLLRLSVGLEHPDDLCADLERAIEASR